MGRTDARSWRGPDAEEWTSGGGVSWNGAADASFGGPKGQIILDIVETAASLVAVGVTDWDQENTNDTTGPRYGSWSGPEQTMCVAHGARAGARSRSFEEE